MLIIKKYFDKSYSRKEKYHPGTSPNAAVSRSGDPPWILKQDGLEGSVLRLISSKGTENVTENNVMIRSAGVFYRCAK